MFGSSNPFGGGQGPSPDGRSPSSFSTTGGRNVVQESGFGGGASGGMSRGGFMPRNPGNPGGFRVQPMFGGPPPTTARSQLNFRTVVSSSGAAGEDYRPPRPFQSDSPQRMFRERVIDAGAASPDAGMFGRGRSVQSRGRKIVQSEDQGRMMDEGSPFKNKPRLSRTAAGGFSQGGVFRRAMGSIGVGRARRGGATSRFLQDLSGERRPREVDTSAQTSICCRNIPMNLNNKPYLSQHFSKYGDITHIHVNKNKLTANIHFATHEDAVRAKENGRVLRDGLAPITIILRPPQPVRNKNTSERSAETRQQVTEEQPGHVTRSLFSSEAQDEIQALGGADFLDDVGVPQERPEEVRHKMMQGQAVGTGLEVPSAPTKKPLLPRPRHASNVPGFKPEPSGRKPEILFGKKVASGSPVKRQEDSGGLFRKNTKPETNQSIGEVPGILFGKKTETRQITEEGLFGNTKVDTESKQSTGESSGLLFGKQTETKQNTGDGPGMLLGKTKPDSETRQSTGDGSGGLFGKTSIESSSSPAAASQPSSSGVFGTAATANSAGALFGKPVLSGSTVDSSGPAGSFAASTPQGGFVFKTNVETDTTKNLFGKSADKSESVSAFKGFGTSTSAGGTVFGASVGMDAQAATDKDKMTAGTSSLAFSFKSSSDTTVTKQDSTTDKTQELFKTAPQGHAVPFSSFTPAEQMDDTQAESEMATETAAIESQALSTRGIQVAPGIADNRGVSPSQVENDDKAQEVTGTEPQTLFGKKSVPSVTVTFSTAEQGPKAGETASSSTGSNLEPEAATATGAPAISTSDFTFKPVVCAPSTSESAGAPKFSFKPVFHTVASSDTAAPSSSAQPLGSIVAPKPTVVSGTGMFARAELTTRKEEGSDLKVESDQPPARRERTVSPVTRIISSSLTDRTSSRSRSRSPSPRPGGSGVSPTRRTKPAATVKLAGSSFIELKALRGTVANTSTDRLAVLENRDKTLHQARKRKRGKTKGEQVTQGTCQDMCPEKERYLREDRRRLALWEVLPGTESNPVVDHVRAVKEYSRSSADQEFPLPHDLRPAPVLAFTMNYLLNHIVDRGKDGDWGEWYDFLWNRTRGIRKDITQQRLCDPTAVELIEKCARFHIFCAERLCEEDMSVFDVKINNENLTKCLQSLKEMYHDLKVKQGVACPNEAEFRAYMVLMNLNEGDILRETQQLDATIRSAPEVTFVLNVHSALNSNNYVRFFKLLDKATFLQACIMHRYFSQMRILALKVITKAFRGAGTSMYPVDELVRLLLFEDEDEVENFCIHHGLNVESGNLVLDRNSQVILPETAYLSPRAPRIIENKRTVDMGQVLNGGPLTPWVPQTPESSFDRQGLFTGMMVEIQQEDEDEDAGSAAEVGTVPVPAVSEVTQVKEKKKYTNEGVKSVAREMFNEVIDEFALSISKSCVQAIEYVFKFGEKAVPEVIGEQVAVMAREVCVETIDEAKRIQAETEARRKAELAAAKQQAMEDVMEDLVGDVVDSMVEEQSREKYREVQHQLKQESQERCSVEEAGELMEEVLDEFMEDVAEEVYETDVVQRLKELEDAYHAVELLRCQSFWRKWRWIYDKRLRLKRGMLNFPSAPCMVPAKDCLKNLIPSATGIKGKAMEVGTDAVVTLQAAPTVLEAQERFQREMLLYHYLCKLRHQKAWTPLNLSTLISRHVRKTTQGGKPFQWKLLVSLPDPSGEDDKNYCDWVKAKFQKGDTPQNSDSTTDLLCLYHTTERRRSPFGVCVRSVTGPLSSAGRDLHGGTSAFLFLITSDELETNGWSAVKKRLHSQLSVLRTTPKIPVTVIVQSEDTAGDLDIQEVVSQLGLSDLKSGGQLSDFSVLDMVEDYEDPRASRVLGQAVRWLSSHCPTPVEVTSSPLKEVVEVALSREFYPQVYQNLKQRRLIGLLDQDPNTLITLYNAVLEFLADQVVGDNGLCQLSGPVLEFTKGKVGLPQPGWNSEDNLDHVRGLVLSLTLPEFSYSQPDTEEWDVAQEDVMNYAQSLVQGEAEDNSHLPLFTRVRWLLAKAEEKFDSDCFLVARQDNCSPCYVNMPWTEIISACISHQMALLNEQSDRGRPERGVWVHYLPKKMNGFVPPSSWLEATQNTGDTDAPTVMNTAVRASTKRKKEKQAHEKAKIKQFKTSHEAEWGLFTVPASVVKLTSASRRLSDSLKEERRHSRKFEAFLQKALQEGSAAAAKYVRSPVESVSPLGLAALFSEEGSPFTPGVAKRLSGQFSTPRSASPKAIKQKSPWDDTPTGRGSKRTKYGEDFSDNIDRRNSLSEDLEDLQRMLRQGRIANQLHEIKLQRMINQSPL